MPIDATARYERHRISSSMLFKKGSFRTLDIGEAGKIKLIRGRLRKSDKWATQSVIIEKQYARKLRKQVNEIVRKSLKELRR